MHQAFRRGEVLALRWKDVDVKTGTLGTLEKLGGRKGRQGWDDIHKPFFQSWEALEVRFHHLHDIFREFHAALIGRCDQCYDGPLALPRHRRSKPDHRLNRVKQGTVPVVFQDAPAPLDRIVLRGYPETGVGKTVDLLDSWRTSYQHRSARPWFIEYCRERTILPI